MLKLKHSLFNSCIRSVLLHLQQNSYRDILANSIVPPNLQDNSGKISLGELREVCIQFNLPVEPELLESMFAYCDVDGDGQINYDEFANFLNWKDKMPSGAIKGAVTTTHQSDTSEVKVRKRCGHLNLAFYKEPQ